METYRILKKWNTRYPKQDTKYYPQVRCYFLFWKYWGYINSQLAFDTEEEAWNYIDRLHIPEISEEPIYRQHE
jgi:hypothetical protein